jgi:hypothetical protein
MSKSIAVGICHPKGENSEYDGFFYKENEFKKLASQLHGKPIYYEHDENCKVGSIISAWSGIGKNNDKEMYVMFDLDTNTLPGILADKMIEDEHIYDLSLGHKVTVENSEGSEKVIDKEAFEVSICKKGARPNTHIYQVYRYTPSKKYIKKYRNLSSSKIIEKMTDIKETTPLQQEQVEDKVEEKVEEKVEKTSENVQVTESILEQFRMLQERNNQMESELSQFKANGKRQREDTLKSGVRDFIMKTIQEEEGLKQYSEHMEKLMSDMVDAESATPMLQFLKCAAAKSKTSVVELEKAYQEKKEFESQIKKLRHELERNDTPFLSRKEERIEAVASSSSSKKPMRKQSLAHGPGLKKFNQNLWQEINNDIMKHC